MRQLIFLFGEEVFKLGLKTYFSKYSFANTQLSDFIGEMSAAVKNLNISTLNEVDITEWSHEWLDSAGCSEI